MARKTIAVPLAPEHAQFLEDFAELNGFIDSADYLLGIINAALDEEMDDLGVLERYFRSPEERAGGDFDGNMQL